MKPIKLNKIEGNRISRKEMNQVRGGQDTLSCTCGCQYADKGGSSISANCSANTNTGKKVPAGVEVKCFGTGTVMWTQSIGG